MGDRARLWVRVSTGKQDEAAQVPDLLRYAAAQGYEVGEARYTLRDVSAYKGEQEAMQRQALADMKAGQYDVLLVWASDRLDRRGIRKTLGLLEEFRQAGGRVECPSESWMASADPEAELSGAVRSWVNERESAHKAERTRIGLELARAAGGATANPPTGYEWDPASPKRCRQWRPAEWGREHVQQVFEDVAGGMSVREAGRAHGLAPATVAKMIRNPAYKGTAQNAAGVITYRPEPLVDAALWKRANDALGEVKRHARGRAAKSAFAGAVRCGRCGGAMYKNHAANRHGNERAYSYYRCNPCKLAVPAGELEAWANARLSGEGSFVIETVTYPGRTYEAEIEAVEWELRELGRQGLDEDAEDARRAELRAERRRLQALPAEQPLTVEEVQAYTVGDLWGWMDDVQRRRYLADGQVRVLVGGRGAYRIEGDLVHASFGWSELARQAGDGEKRPAVSSGTLVAYA